MPDLSLVIATYNWTEALHLCLLSVKQQVMLPSEVIIADDGSDLNTKILIQKMQEDFPVNIIHVWHEDLGFRKSLILNKAVKKASGSYIVQVDGDVILERHFIADHKSVAEKDVFIRGTRAHIRQDLIQQIYSDKRINFNFLSGGIINRFNALRLPFLAFLFEKKIKSSNSVRGSNMSYWKADFALINGYNNELQGWGHEDEELAARFINNQKFKKAIKLKAIQFHLSHKEASKANAHLHDDVVRYTLKNELKTCINGYEQS